MGKPICMNNADTLCAQAIIEWKSHNLFTFLSMYSHYGTKTKKISLCWQQGLEKQIQIEKDTESLEKLLLID